MAILPVRIDFCSEQKGKNIGYRVFILLLTFFAYTSYHLSRKPISVVKSVLHHNCTVHNGTKDCGFAPFDGDNYSELEGSLDYSYLFAYAIGMFFSGHIAERMNLRYFLAFGMMGSGILTALFGFGKYWNIHSMGYYIAVQVVGGLFQSTGWPSVVTCVANWFGKGKRGAIMGLWNIHTSVGNALGSYVAGVFVNDDWAMSFIVPGIIIGSMGIIIFLFLVPSPLDVGLSEPDHLGITVDFSGKNITEADPLVQREVMQSETMSTTSSVRDDVRESESEYGSGAETPISFLRALKIPGVLEFAFCLFFAKLVSYTFLYWLPFYISHSITSFNPEQAADLSIVFDVGGAGGGIVAGIISDASGTRATVCAVMLFIAAPMMYIYQLVGSESLTVSIVTLLITGAFVNGPYALITTAVSADLGTHPSLLGNSKALATVTAIIDGTGSMGAALGPLLTGLISAHGSWQHVFYMLIAADVCALMLLSRLVAKEGQRFCGTNRNNPQLNV